MTESTSERVECPICGDGFDPMAAGGWCTNPNCGEWQYLGDEVPEPAETAPAGSVADTADETESDAADDTDPADEWTEPPTGAGSSPESGGEAESESDEADATAASADDELKLEFGAAPGSGDEASDDAASEADEEPPEAAEPDGEETALEACPSCGADVDADDAFCAACGADLRSDGEADSETPDRLALTARGEEVLVSPDQTVGREVRRILTDTGGDEDDAVRIHREHVRFVRENGQFYVVDLGDNPTELNGSRLSKGDREPVEPGDELVLSDVVTLSVERP